MSAMRFLNLICYANDKDAERIRQQKEQLRKNR